MTILSTDDADLYYELHGEGPPLVLIHGASGTHLSWWQQVAELRYHYSCLIYDLRGYGRSRPKGDYDPGDGHQHYRDLARLIEHVGFGGEKVSLIGASLGTAPALYFAAEHPARVDKLVLVCGPGGAATPRITASWAERAERMRTRGQELARRIESGGPVIATPGVPPIRSRGEMERFAVAYHPYGPVGEAMHLDFPALTFLYAEIMASAEGPPTAKTIPVFASRPVTPVEATKLDFPVLVVGGTEDPLFAAAELTEVAALFPKGRCELFKGAGHLCYYERPRRFNDLVAAFLRGGGGR
jgi:pimeloyl-ACP methyl ester carboxylesterase